MSSWIINSNRKSRPRVFLNKQNKENTQSTSPTPPTQQENIVINKVSTNLKCYEPQYFSIDNVYLVNYFDKLRKEFKIRNIKKVTNVFKTTYKNIKGNGIGDFIRGSYCLSQICNVLGIEFDMNCNYHKIRNILKTTEEVIPDSILENIEHKNILNQYIEYFISGTKEYLLNVRNYNSFMNDIIELLLSAPVHNNTSYVYVIAFPLFEINTESKHFIQKKIEYNSEMENYLNYIFKTLNIEKNQYKLIHIRSGDKFIHEKNTIKFENYSNYLDALIKIVKNKIDKNKYVLICDSNLVKNYVSHKIPELCVYKNKIIHLGELDNVDYIKENMLDFYFCRYANLIYSITCYQHGTGFSKWCAITYDIPFCVDYCSYM